MEPNPYESPQVAQAMQKLTSRDGKHCPACLRDIGVLAVVKAPLPNRVRCPHCRARLAYQGTLWMIVGASCVVFAIAVGLIFLLEAVGVTHLGVKLVVVLSSLALIWLALEFVGAYYLRNSHILIKVG